MNESFGGLVPLENACCPVCESDGRPVFQQRDLLCGIAGEFGQRYCVECQVFFLSPRVPEREIWRYYPESYLPYRRARYPALVSKLAKALGLPFRRRRIVESFIRSGRILDVGCGNGTFLMTLEGGRWDTYGMDIKRTAGEDLRAEFHEGRFDHEKPPWNRFEVITLWHVFEHLYHPREALRHAWELLRPGGILFLAVPDPTDIERRVFGKHWIGWDPPRHIATYSKVAMETLLREAGFLPLGNVPDVCTGELILLNFDLLLHSRGIDSNLRRSIALRVLLAPVMSIQVRLGWPPARVYVARK